ncbi:hypothetical protein LOZ12_000820 [Ophidiomyces ophidiicola]|nr:hypothetical protein LOZ62_000446 [Ophidiomyces ophidiicola]KAI2072018.1 hypothetical protein LOZ37_004457 [Ophidiomyces ophidiicola]KAI2086201.1 hypothetical protein LOZ35_006450 [Ophidiomyces ophidiicola]KAI2113431.1 hypothetical protein LOZ32_005513 [Ophidiomyces ophidiicola]KAI2122481.1 hypothetical protein LOZ42_000576 [Ophidiomyces ophidiicola]
MLGRSLASMSLLPLLLPLTALGAAVNSQQPPPAASPPPSPSPTSPSPPPPASSTPPPSTNPPSSPSPPPTPSLPLPTTPSSTSSRSPATHTVQVGPKSDPHKYVPRSLKAEVGDTVIFEFYPRNHSVVQADFMSPCVPASGNYFYSGIFNQYEEKDGVLVGKVPTWSIRINDTKPIFYYCTALDSCIGNGMVGAINPNRTMSYESQFAKALQYPYMLVPGQAPPAEGERPSAPTNTPAVVPQELSSGAIAGIVVGCVVVVAMLGALFFLLGRNRVYHKWLASEDGTAKERTRRWALNGGDWATNSEKDSHIAPSQVGYINITSPDGLQPGPYSPPLRSPPPGYLGWDRANMYQPHPRDDGPPPELSSGMGVQLVELEARPITHPNKELYMQREADLRSP